MKIVVSGYIGKKITGIGRNLMSLLNTSNSDNKYIIYTNIDMKDDFIFTNPNVEVKTYAVSKNNSLMNLLWTTFIFPFKVLKEKADRSLIPNFTLLLFKFKPTVVIMHDLIEFNVPNKFSKKKMFYRTKIADPITAKMADKIITVSENSKRDIIKFLRIGENKISVVYNGVDQNKFYKMNKREINKIFKQRNWPNDFILYAGTIDHPGKNAMNVIKSFENLKKKGKYKGHLVLAGMPGSGYEIIEEHINQSKYKEDIILTGYVSDEELVALYSACQIFCFISLYEGFGIPPLEALACGAKVVVSNTSSLPEVVGEIGYTVNPTDIKKITKVLDEVLNIPNNNKYLKKVKEHINKYDWKVLSKDFENYITK